MSYISMPSFRALFIQYKLRPAKQEQALFALTCIVFGTVFRSAISSVVFYAPSFNFEIHV